MEKSEKEETPPDKKDCLTTVKLADFLGIKLCTLHKKIEKGEIKNAKWRERCGCRKRWWTREEAKEIKKIIDGQKTLRKR